MAPIEDNNDETEEEDSFDSKATAPDFMPNAWDIMNKFPCPDAAALTKICSFRETFGMRLPIVSKVWLMLWEENLLPEGGGPKHLLWALYFLKVYPLQAPGCAAVGTSGGAINLKTHRKWVWSFIKAVSELMDVVVSFTLTM